LSGGGVSCDDVGNSVLQYLMAQGLVHVFEADGGLGAEPGFAGAAAGEVTLVASVECVPDDDEGVDGQAEGDRALDRPLDSVARLADPEDLLAE
jgi:hypothetical protein